MDTQDQWNITKNFRVKPILTRTCFSHKGIDFSFSRNLYDPLRFYIRLWVIGCTKYMVITRIYFVPMNIYAERNLDKKFFRCRNDGLIVRNRRELHSIYLINIFAVFSSYKQRYQAIYFVVYFIVTHNFQHPRVKSFQIISVVLFK